MSPSEFFGRMTDPSAGAWVVGPCGDTMEFYLVITNDCIEQIRYHTDGCRHTHRCGETVAQYILGKSVREALNISVGQILTDLHDLPQSHQHCAILAVSSLYRAIAQYWIQQAGS